MIKIITSYIIQAKNKYKKKNKKQWIPSATGCSKNTLPTPSLRTDGPFQPFQHKSSSADGMGDLLGKQLMMTYWWLTKDLVDIQKKTNQMVPKLEQAFL